VSSIINNKTQFQFRVWNRKSAKKKKGQKEEKEIF
jgi:hypothetical protein